MPKRRNSKKVLSASRYRVIGTQRRTKFYLKPDRLATGFPQYAAEFVGPDSAMRAALRENNSGVWGFKWKVERFTKSVKLNPSQVAKVQARGGKRFVVATHSKESDTKLLDRVNAVKVIKRINTNGLIEATAGLQALEYLGGKVMPKRFPKRRNASPVNEWDFDDDDLNESARLGSQQARALGHSEREHRQAPKLFTITWYSPLRGKRTGFMRPIEAHNMTDAKRQAKAMITNDPKATNFVAKEAKRANPTKVISANIGEKIAQLTREGMPHNQAVAVAFAEKRTGKINPRRKKRNPASIREMSERFNGKASGAVIELKAASNAPASLSRAGKLVLLKLVDGHKVLRIPGAVVCIDPKTERLWIAGNRAPLLNRKAKPGERLSCGELERIVYETAKKHIGHGKTFEYDHKFETPRPSLHIDDEGMPLIVGGDYKIRKEGIVN